MMELSFYHFALTALLVVVLIPLAFGYKWWQGGLKSQAHVEMLREGQRVLDDQSTNKKAHLGDDLKEIEMAERMEDQRQDTTVPNSSTANTVVAWRGDVVGDIVNSSEERNLSAVWYWKEDADRVPDHNPEMVLAETDFVAYSQDISIQIEQAYQLRNVGRGIPEYRIDLTNKITSTATGAKVHGFDGEVLYTVNFEEMKQHNSVSGYARCVRREMIGRNTSTTSVAVLGNLPLVPATTLPPTRGNEHGPPMNITRNDNDVLFGRGGGTTSHPGNRLFRRLVQHNKQAYKAFKKDSLHKNFVVRSITRVVSKAGGRFLKEQEGDWVVAKPKEARHKTAAALREKDGPGKPPGSSSTTSITSATTSSVTTSSTTAINTPPVTRSTEKQDTQMEVATGSNASLMPASRKPIFDYSKKEFKRMASNASKQSIMSSASSITTTSISSIITSNGEQDAEEMLDSNTPEQPMSSTTSTTPTTISASSVSTSDEEQDDNFTRWLDVWFGS